MHKITLPSGHKMPVLGLGTWQATGDEAKQAVKRAIELGYRAIDTAWIYQNQKEIGEALKEISIPREELFITSKLWNDMHTYDDVIASCKETLQQLQLEYLDLFLIHWPVPSVPIEETMRALKTLVDEGLVKSVGVSNFSIKNLRDALAVSDVKISMNQVEFHPGLYQKDLLEFCNKSNIAVTGYCPIAKGKNFDDPSLKSVAEKHNKTPAQVSLRWLIQHGIFVIPKSVSEEHLKENMETDFELDAEDMDKIDSMPAMDRICDPPFAEWD
jgi:diketogulonate reductase-like aldo/keto reductase